jgi:hypothetical protein
VIGRSRAERKAAAALRAQLALQHSFERIDYDYDVIVPELQKIRELEKENVVDVEAPELEAGEVEGHEVLGNA